MKVEKVRSKSNVEFKIGDSNKQVNFSEKDEPVIWEQFKKGDDQSLIYLYRTYANALFNYGRQLTDRDEFVRDCIQELFCDLIDRRKRLADVLHVKSYLFVSLKRKILKGLKKEERFQLHEGSIQAFELSFSANSVSISQTFDKDDYALIEKKLNSLPTLQKEVILLHFYEGMGYAEIARLMNIKVKSARALTYRAIASLAKKLSTYKEVFYLFRLISNS